MTNTMRKVTIVVPVLMVSCQKSEKPNRGPVTAQMMITSPAAMTAAGLPAQLATCEANLANRTSKPVWLITNLGAPVKPAMEADTSTNDNATAHSRVPERNTATDTIATMLVAVTWSQRPWLSCRCDACSNR